MAGTDRRDPNETGEELDLSEFYRDGSDFDPRRTARTTARLDIQNYYRTDVERETARTTNSLHIEDYLRAGHDPDAFPDHGEPEWESEGSIEPGQHLASAPSEAQHRTPDSSVQPATSDEDPLTIAAAAEAEHDASPAGSAGATPLLPAAQPAPAAKTIYRYASIGALFGVVFAAVAIMLSWVFSSPSGPYDLGAATSDATGLKGHLYTKWEEKRLDYRLSFEPSDKDYKAGFSWVTGNPPRPLAIEIQIKDAMGFTLCTRNILLPFDPLAAVPPDQDATKANAQAADAPTPDQLQAVEAQRERGQEIFQLQAGSSGQIESIAAQGDIPCSLQAYQKAATWSFTPDFPTVAEQNDLMRQPAILAAARAAALRRKATAKKVQGPLNFVLEGDNVLVGYDASAGAFETSSGSPFYVDKDSAALTQPAWQNFPIHIHYRCDSVAGCTLTRTGSAAPLHARMRK